MMDLASPEHLDARIEVSRLLSCLTPREREVVDLRLGLSGGRHTLEEVGRVIPRNDGGVGLSRDRVRQIECRAFRKMRHRLRAQGAPLPSDVEAAKKFQKEVKRRNDFAEAVRAAWLRAQTRHVGDCDSHVHAFRAHAKDMVAKQCDAHVSLWRLRQRPQTPPPLHLMMMIPEAYELIRQPNLTTARLAGSNTLFDIDGVLWTNVKTAMGYYIGLRSKQ